VDYSAYDYILIEELQFFENAYEEINFMLSEGKKVIAAGLDGDFMRNPFGDGAKLVNIASEVKKLVAVCKYCNHDALFSKRYAAERDIKMVGAGDVYAPVCRTHYNQNSPVKSVEVKAIPTDSF
jgi:thymidine kinase